MTIASDPNLEDNNNSDDEFDTAFNEFAAGRSAPPHEDPPEPAEPDGNGPAPAPSAPAPQEPATDTDDGTETATSGDANPDGGSPPPAGDTVPDPWADAPEPLKAELARLQRERDEAKHAAQSDAHRVAALSRKLQQLTTATPTSAPAPVSEPTEAQKALDEKIKELRENYGDIANPLIELFETQKQELTTVRTTLEGLSEQRQAEVIASETQALEQRHPDWRQIAASSDWSGWLELQPRNIQSLAQSWDARETSVALSLFKAERAETTGQTEPVATPLAPKADAATGVKRSQQLDGGADVRSRPAPAASGPPEDFDEAFQFFAEKRRLKEASQRR